jgi:ATP-dependent Lon protease
MDNTKDDSQAFIEKEKERLVNEPVAILPVKSTIVFPGLVTSLMVAEARHTKLIDETLMAGKPLGLFTQKDS